MSDAVHLLIPFAIASSDSCRLFLRDTKLPNLSRLLGRLAIASTDEGTTETLSPPHERALAREMGLPVADGLIPWAGWAAHQAGRDSGSGWAWITPCHLRVGRDHIAMAPVDDVALEADETQAFLQAVQPYFQEDGLSLLPHSPGRWLAQGPALAALATASLDRVEGRVVDAWLPKGDSARTLRRLQQEMQMLLYTHPLNEARTERGLLPVNSFWISGTGPVTTSMARTVTHVKVADALRGPALRNDWPGWQQAWETLDAEVVPSVAQASRVQVTLCGERSARTWSSDASSLARRVASMFRDTSPAALMETL